MENLPVAIPPQLAYEVPERAILSSNKSVSVKPQSGSSVGSTTSSASSSDVISIKLPNVGIAPTSRMYLKYTITVKSDGTDDNSVSLDNFAPDASIFKRLVLKSSDGTTINDIANYNAINSLLASVNESSDYQQNQGSVMYGMGGEDDYATQLVNNSTGTSMNVGWKEASRRGSARFSATAGADVSKTLIHHFRVGLLSSHEDHYLPLSFLGSGLTLELTLEDAKNAMRVFKAEANDTPLGQALANADSSVTYGLTNVELHMDLLSYDPSIQGQISNRLCDGLRFKSGRVRTQNNSVSSTENNIVINDHARSVEAIVFGCRLGADIGKAERDEFNYRYATDADGTIKEYQFAIGSNNVPQDRVSFGADSYKHLEQAMRPYFGEKFQMGNQINKANYLKGHSSNLVNVGRAFGAVNLKSHPALEDVLSGVSASSGSIPINLALTFDNAPASDTQVQVFTFSSQVVEFLADGAVIIHK